MARGRFPSWQETVRQLQDALGQECLSGALLCLVPQMVPSIGFDGTLQLAFQLGEPAASSILLALARLELTSSESRAHMAAEGIKEPSLRTEAYLAIFEWTREERDAASVLNSAASDTSLYAMCRARIEEMRAQPKHSGRVLQEQIRSGKIEPPDDDRL